VLTKNLLRLKKGPFGIEPRFVPEDHPTLLEFSRQLIEVYHSHQGMSFMEIEELSNQVLSSCKDLKLAKGLNKILQDRSEFDLKQDGSHEEFRKNLFSISGVRLLTLTRESYDDYRSQIESEFQNLRPNSEQNFLDRIYGDLPENEKLLSFKDLSPKELLERYNCSLVQSLLLHASSITLFIKDGNPVRMRRFFRYLKFFRLLARIYGERRTETSSQLSGGSSPQSTFSDQQPAERAKESRGFKITIDGPLSLFENTQKYGLQLASFFPAVCDLEKWQLESRIKLSRRSSLLKVDYSSNLKNHYRNFQAYLPPEIDLFERHFLEASSEWKILDSLCLIHTGDQELIFPDFIFQNTDGRIMHLELFHRWHASALLQRLQFGKIHPECPLLIGVDRSLSRNPQIKNKLNHSAWFSKHGFTFNGFPLVSTVKELLETMIQVI
jgi:uncharacterized protein